MTQEEENALITVIGNLSFCVGYLCSDEFIAKHREKWDPNIKAAMDALTSMRNRGYVKQI